MAGALQVLTANRLADGEVVYGARGAWVIRLAEAELIGDAETAKARLAAAEADVAARRVVNPYLFEAQQEGGAIVPVKVREAIRAKGPTVRRDLGKQADENVPL